MKAEHIRFLHDFSQIHMAMKEANDPEVLCDEIILKFPMEDIFLAINFVGRLMDQFVRDAEAESNPTIQCGRWVFATSITLGFASVLHQLKPHLERMVVGE